MSGSARDIRSSGHRRGAPLGRVFATLATAAVAAALALAPASVASAHDYLVQSNPAVGSVQTKPISEVTLTFDDIVLDLSGDGSSSIVQVTGPDAGARHFETGCPKILGRVVSVPVALGGAGKYTVAWQIVSADGHTVSQSMEFAYRPPAGTVAATGRSSRPVCGANSSGTSAATTAPTAGATANGGDLGLVIGIASGIVALAVIGVIVVLVTGRRKPREGAAWKPGEE